VLVNKSFKKYLITSFIIIIIFLIVFLRVNILEFKNYNYQNNIFINNLISNILDKYPDLKKDEIIDLLNNPNLENNNVLKEYGIDLISDSLVLKNETMIKQSIILNMIIILLLSFFLVITYVIYKRQKDNELKQISLYLEDITSGNYKLEIDTNTTDDLSILKNEIYKITVMLKETNLILKQDKLLLKTSLEDLSHQLKTPLTGIMLMLDALDKCDNSLKKDYVKDIKRLVLNINFLVNSLLKLAKFDANTIVFHNEKIKLKEIIDEAIKNVSVLAELKNIKIENIGNENNQMIGDLKWQVEAITNILKNSCEYSKENSKIEILHEENKMYSKITIKDYGCGMDSKDLKHLFERFYKGKNSSSDSVGIGMSLAKAIIEHNNGYITVNSKVLVGTIFVIKYLK